MTVARRENDDTKLVLLGAWNTTPLRVWPWFSEIAVQHFRKLSGYRLRGICLFEDGLCYEYYLQKDTRLLFRNFDRLSHNQKKFFVKKIWTNYFRELINKTPGVHFVLKR